MFRAIAQFINALKSRFRSGNGARESGTLRLGFRVVDDEVTRRPVAVTNVRRSTHVAVLGKTGSGKSSFLRYLSAQDIEAGRGFVYFDLHGDATPFLMRTISARERNSMLIMHVNHKSRIATLRNYPTPLIPPVIRARMRTSSPRVCRTLFAHSFPYEQGKLSD